MSCICRNKTKKDFARFCKCILAFSFLENWSLKNYHLVILLLLILFLWSNKYWEWCWQTIDLTQQDQSVYFSAKATESQNNAPCDIWYFNSSTFQLYLVIEWNAGICTSIKWAELGQTSLWHQENNYISCGSNVIWI